MKKGRASARPDVVHAGSTSNDVAFHGHEHAGEFAGAARKQRDFPLAVRAMADTAGAAELNITGTRHGICREAQSR
jgi:hypothetical protein